jgi:Glycosyl transferase family 2
MGRDTLNTSNPTGGRFEPGRLLVHVVRPLAIHWVRRALWLLLVPALRMRARRRLPRLQRGVATVVTVNWDSHDYLEVFLRVVRRRSPAGTRILVVDNGSRDRSRQLLAASRGVSSVRLPFNVGHDLALDIGFLQAKTEYVVALDVDAFPLSESWLAELLSPLSEGCEISGARLNREYVHPCCLAMRTARFVERNHSFRSYYRARTEHRDASGDVGEEMSARERGRLHFFDISSQRGPGDVGTIFGSLVYHNFYATRFQATSDAVLDRMVSKTDPEAAWEEALRLYGA